jgi:SAM-dependent methyltransferase
MKQYWSQRFIAEGKIWGEHPSISARHAAVLFESIKAESVLVPGCGYGRHTGYFDAQGFDTDGIEISHEALEIARSEHPHISYYEGSVLDMPYTEKKYDAIYCFNVLHLFTADDRKRFITNCKDALNVCGAVYMTVFSEQEPSYGSGIKIEDNTFETKPGRPVHYFTEHDLIDSFAGFDILDTGIVDEHEDHGEQGPHVHRLRYIFARKSDK